MSLTAITVTARYVTGANKPCTGRDDFALNKVIRDTVSGAIVDKEVDSVTLDASGRVSITLFATDDVDANPKSAVYRCIERIDGARANQLTFALPHTSAGGTFDLSSLG